MKVNVSKTETNTSYMYEPTYERCIHEDLGCVDEDGNRVLKTPTPEYVGKYVMHVGQKIGRENTVTSSYKELCRMVVTEYSFDDAIDNDGNPVELCSWDGIIREWIFDKSIDELKEYITANYDEYYGGANLNDFTFGSIINDVSNYYSSLEAALAANHYVLSMAAINSILGSDTHVIGYMNDDNVIFAIEDFTNCSKWLKGFHPEVIPMVTSDTFVESSFNLEEKYPEITSGTVLTARVKNDTDEDLEWCVVSPKCIAPSYDKGFGRTNTAMLNPRYVNDPNSGYTPKNFKEFAEYIDGNNTGISVQNYSDYATKRTRLTTPVNCDAHPLSFDVYIDKIWQNVVENGGYVKIYPKFQINVQYWDIEDCEWRGQYGGYDTITRMNPALFSGNPIEEFAEDCLVNSNNPITLHVDDFVHGKSTVNAYGQIDNLTIEVCSSDGNIITSSEFVLPGAGIEILTRGVRRNSSTLDKHNAASPTDNPYIYSGKISGKHLKYSTSPLSYSFGTIPLKNVHTDVTLFDDNGFVITPKYNWKTSTLKLPEYDLGLVATGDAAYTVEFNMDPSRSVPRGYFLSIDDCDAGTSNPEILEVYSADEYCDSRRGLTYKCEYDYENTGERTRGDHGYFKIKEASEL